MCYNNASVDANEQPLWKQIPLPLLLLTQKLPLLRTMLIAEISMGEESNVADVRPTASSFLQCTTQQRI
jgi:hypothetical protein